MFKLHLVQALGSFWNQLKNNKDTDLRFHRIKSPSGTKLETIPNWSIQPAAGISTGAEPRPDTVLATLVPAPYFSRLTEPAAIVLNRSKEAIRDRSDKLRRIWNAARGEKSTFGQVRGPS